MWIHTEIENTLSRDGKVAMSVRRKWARTCSLRQIRKWPKGRHNLWKIKQLTQAW